MGIDFSKKQNKKKALVLCGNLLTSSVTNIPDTKSVRDLTEQRPEFLGPAGALAVCFGRKANSSGRVANTEVTVALLQKMLKVSRT